jgi:hypothetical protein
MSPPHSQSVAKSSEELGIQAITLYKWRKAWRMVFGLLIAKYFVRGAVTY